MDYFDYFPYFYTFEIKINELWQQTNKSAPLFTSN